MTHNIKTSDTSVKYVDPEEDVTTYLSFGRVRDNDTSIIIQSFKGNELIGHEIILIEIDELKKMVNSI